VIRDIGMTILVFVGVAVISFGSMLFPGVGALLELLLVIVILRLSYDAGKESKWGCIIGFAILVAFDWLLESWIGFGLIVTAAVPPHPIFEVPFFIAIIVAFIVGRIRG